MNANYPETMNYFAFKWLILLLTMLLISGYAGADVYKWVDANGITHYSDKKPENEEFTEIVASSYNSVSYANISDETSRGVTGTADKGKKVVIFSADWCGSCKKAKRYFGRNGIPFKEYDIEKGSKAKQLYKQLGATGVPVIIVGKKRMNGFSEAGFERIYQ